MRGKFRFAITIIAVFSIGCRTAPNNHISMVDAVPSALVGNVYESLTPQFPTTQEALSEEQFDAGPLNDFNFNDPAGFLRLSLDQCIENALTNSQVVRQLGGTALRSPELMVTANDTAIAYTDPRVGEEAALSAFDATFDNLFAFQNNDRAFNSSFIGDQGRLKQKLATNTTRLSKRSATGTLFQLNNQILYDFNNTQANRFSNNVSWDTYLEAEMRQPLLQGAGSLFNRIAGPNNLPGVNNGVLIARTNTDISLANFELGIRNLVSEVENAYWDLYFAYRDLEAKIEARNGAYKIWESLKAQGQNKKAAEILQAEEQYYLFASRVQDAIHGQLNDGTRTFNGSASGTFRGNAGVRTTERRLRLIAGYPVNDQVLIVPEDMPVEAQVVFDWEQSKTDALTKRTELRRQRWVLKREELNLFANKNFLLPRVDLIGKYRLRGFGNDLFGNTGFNPLVPPGVDLQNGSDAYRTFLDGDLQEWELGMDVNIPIGYRRQFAAVRNSELEITRQRKILLEQEREIVYGLSNSLGEVERTSSLQELNARRLDASKQQYAAIQEDFKNDDTTIDLVLESQRRVIDAKLDYFRTQVEFMLAVKSVHFEKGTMLEYHNVSLSENGWSTDDYREAIEREKNKSRPINYYIPGLKVSSPFDERQLGIAGPAPEFLAKQKAKAKSDAMFGDDNTPDDIAPETAVATTTTDNATAEETATPVSETVLVSNVPPSEPGLLEIVDQLKADGYQPESASRQSTATGSLVPGSQTVGTLPSAPAAKPPLGPLSSISQDATASVGTSAAPVARAMPSAVPVATAIESTFSDSRSPQTARSDQFSFSSRAKPSPVKTELVENNRDSRIATSPTTFDLPGEGQLQRPSSSSSARRPLQPMLPPVGTEVRLSDLPDAQDGSRSRR